MRRLSRPQRLVLCVAGLLVTVAAVIGFWPVSVRVMGDTPYSCGSGFVHSRHTWKVDTNALALDAQPVIDPSSSATPLSACPSKLYEQRDFAYLLIVFALVGGLCGVVLLQSESSVRERANDRAARRRVARSDVTRRATGLPSTNLARHRELTPVEVDVVQEIARRLVVPVDKAFDVRDLSRRAARAQNVIPSPTGTTREST